MNTLAIDRGGRPLVSALRNPLVPWYASSTHAPSQGPKIYFGEVVRTETVRHDAKKRCWEGYEATPGVDAYDDGSCRKIGSGKKKKKKKKRTGMKKTTENASALATTRENAASVPGKGGIHSRGSDADGDGKTGEGKKKVADFSDKNKNGKPDAFEGSSSSSEYDSEYESTSDDDASSKNGMAKKRSNASAKEEEDCDCGCPKSLAKKAKAIADAAKATLSVETFVASAKSAEEKKEDCGCSEEAEVRVVTSNAAKKKYYTSDSSDSDSGEKHPTEGVIRRARDGKHDYFVYYKGRKISFGDASMPNKNHSDKHRANFNARHGCDSKKDKTKVQSSPSLNPEPHPVVLKVADSCALRPVTGHAKYGKRVRLRCTHSPPHDAGRRIVR